ncbi:MAG: hypothetical protein IJW98_06530 [Clostridia bacterium]|jgi:hypothetical protein|nr:hypothetical protein [Clostridia bacterium]
METKKPTAKTPEADCEHCLYYDYDEDVEDMVCIMNLDEDEYASMLQGKKNRCPYFRFYDEYKSVQKQI